MNTTPIFYIDHRSSCCAHVVMGDITVSLDNGTNEQIVNIWKESNTKVNNITAYLPLYHSWTNLVTHRREQE